METKMASFEYYDAKTPSSLASSPRDPEGPTSDQTTTTLRHAAARLASSTAPDSPVTPPTAYVLHDLWLAARHTRRDAEGLHGILQIVQGHIHDLQQELVSVAAEMERQEQAHDIKMMERDCEIRLLQAESTAYSMAAMARTATVASLQQSTDALVMEREANTKALANVSADLQEKTIALQAAEALAEASDARTKELESLLDKLQLELDISKERIEELEILHKDTRQELEEKDIQHETAKVLLESAHADASSAAGQLVEACEENAKLSDAVSTLQVELEKRDVQVAQLREESDELKAALSLHHQSQPQPQLTLREGEQSPLKNKSLSASRRVPVAVKTHSNPAFETPGSVRSTASTMLSSGGGSSGAIVAADQDDLLALEVSRLRNHTGELEMQLAESKTTAPVLAALEKEAGVLKKENSALRMQVDHAVLEATEAKRELQQVQLDARVLHGQLSEVISNLAGAGLANSPISLLQQSSLIPSEQHNQQQEQQLLTLPSSSAHDVEAIEDVQLADDKKAITGTPLVGLQSEVSYNRGPPTPTWQTPPAAVASSGGGGDGIGSGVCPAGSDSNTSGGSSDLILAELRSAMAHLDSVTEGGMGEGGREVAKRTTLPPTVAEAPSALPTATDILESISRGIAALSGDNDSSDNKHEMYPATSTMSSSEGAATVTPRT